MLDYGALAALAAVIREGTFEKAAAALHVTPSAISQRVKLLEERVGAVLVRRGQPCEATEEGQHLCRHFESVMLMEKALGTELPDMPGDDGPVTIPIAVNADSLDSWFIQAVSEHVRETGILIDFKVDDQDHTAEWLRRGEVLAAVTAVEKPVQGCRVLALGKLSYRATASNAFIARHFAGGVTAEALSKAPSLTFNRKDRLQSAWVEHHLGHDIARPNHWLPSSQGFVTACLAGIGWGLNPVQLVEAHLRTGALCELVPDTRIETPLYWQVSRRAAPLLERLTRSVVASGREWLA
ncbi:LysR family transcriptional regulator ArgP [Rhizobium sp. L1K21]|uniref:LysR family transcriptional regulator ArgP n=1 Tax=Rhizobium sp. L1K21 TaxID=2954933 RepID=UPI002093D25E|nr:LysR family transcriptional regulator ArgP [Rhizobium sp. L1K21]MCO6186827.1 LysR family transcriptional regulator ArgP [Rhizobium sp. L1K21]